MAISTDVVWHLQVSAGKIHVTIFDSFLGIVAGVGDLQFQCNRGDPQPSRRKTYAGKLPTKREDQQCCERTYYNVCRGVIVVRVDDSSHALVEQIGASIPPKATNGLLMNDVRSVRLGFFVRRVSGQVRTIRKTGRSTDLCLERRQQRLTVIRSFDAASDDIVIARSFLFQLKAAL